MVEVVLAGAALLTMMLLLTGSSGTAVPPSPMAAVPIRVDPEETGPDLPCPWCYGPTREDDVVCPTCGQRFG